MSITSANPVIAKLTQFLKEYQDDMPGGAAKLLNGLIKSDITDTTDTALHFDKIDTLQHSGGSALSDESKRKRVLQLNSFFELHKSEFTVTSRKHNYLLEFPDSLSEQLSNQAFEDYALSIADETDPDDFQTPEADIGRLVFVSHNWRDKDILKISRQFLQELEQQLADRATDELNIDVFCDLSEKNNFKLHKGLQQQQDSLCKQAQLCLILWNPGYEKSIACKQELSFFVDEDGQNLPNKNAIAILERGRIKDVKNSKTERISKRLLFNYPHGSDHSLIEFWHDANPGEKYNYVAGLVDHIEACFCDKSKQPSREQRLKESLIKATDMSVDEGLDKDLCDGNKHQIPEGFEGSISNSHRIEIVPCLADWANTAVSRIVPRITVLLGDFGFGKTVTCRLLARHLSELYKNDKHTCDKQCSILPIYLDLKALLGDLENHLKQPIEHLLETMLAKTGETTEFTGQNIIQTIQTLKCLVIFDGFDEIGHKLNRSQQQAMYHKLLDIIPAKVYGNDVRRTDHKKWDQGLAVFPSKLLISCRTHFFNHIRQETSFLTGNERHVVSETNIRRFYMAPFKPEAIKKHLIDALDDEEQGQQAYKMLGDIHDLSDLSKHPIMLRLISRQIPFLQEMKAKQKTVNSALLYLQMFESIGERDTDKHLIALSDKQRLLAQLAFDLWINSETVLSFQRLEQWFKSYSSADNFLARQSMIKEDSFQKMLTDLCNATLLVRDSDDKYRFAHTSYMEFFRALGIFEFIKKSATLENIKIDKLKKLKHLPKINNETLQFIINWWEVCDETEKHEFRIKFVNFLEHPKNTGSKWLSYYIWRFAIVSLGPPNISKFPHSISPDWSDMNFSREFIEPEYLTSLDRNNLIDINKANFSGSYFFNIPFYKLDFSNADFENCIFVRCAFQQCKESPSLLEKAVLHKTSSSCFNRILPYFYQARTIDHNFYSIKSFKSKFYIAIKENQSEVTLWHFDKYKKKLEKHITFDALQGNLNCIKFSPCGKLLATTGSDQLIRIWSTEYIDKEPECLFTISEYGLSIEVLEFSSNGRFLIAAGGDFKLRVWNIEKLKKSTKCLYVLDGHQSSITALSLSVSDDFFASASKDDVINIWHTKNFLNKPKCIESIESHLSSVEVMRFKKNNSIISMISNFQGIANRNLHR